MPNLGLRHAALLVRNAQKSKDFYCKHFKMDVEWEPDPKSVYLTTQGQDNLALHETTDPKPIQGLDHLGFFFSTKDEVLEIYESLKSDDVTIAKEPKQHRDGAFSFYFRDLDGFIIQVLYHPPVANIVKT